MQGRRTATNYNGIVHKDVDVGALAGHPRAIYIGPGYAYWYSMFGVTAAQSPGTRRPAATLVAEIHL